MPALPDPRTTPPRRTSTRRGWLAAVACVPLLAACGFHLRRAPDFGFRTIHLGVAPNSALGQELRRQLLATGKVRLVDAAQAEVLLDVLQDQRERSVVGLTATSQVRELTLRQRFRFRLRNAAGQELVPPTEIVREMDMSYNETHALALEQEAEVFYRNMQADIVQQLMRRLAMVRPGEPPESD